MVHSRGLKQGQITSYGKIKNHGSDFKFSASKFIESLE